MCRLTQSHRPTRDVDTLVRSAEVSGRDLLLAAAARATATGVVLADGTRIDVVDVLPALDVRQLPADDGQRMFVLAHWWMAESAEDVELQVVSARTAAAVAVVSRQLRLARRGPLMAAKLQSIPTRRGPTEAKRTSDAYDVFRLLQTGPADLAAELSDAPGDLTSWCAGTLERLFVADAVRTSRWLADAAGIGATPADFAGLEELGRAAVAELRRVARRQR